MNPRKLSNRILPVLISALVMFALPFVAAAQGRRGRGLAHRRDMSWKCRVFVNCHDARDGRLDGRGPRANRVALRNQVFVNRGRRMRVRRFRDFDNDERLRARRTRERNPDLDRDEFLRRERVRPPDRSFENRPVFRENQPVLRSMGRGRRP